MQTATHQPVPPDPEPQHTAQMQRVRAEYVEMPGLHLTVAQAARLFGVTVGDADQLLSEMVDEHFLQRDSRGLYKRGGCPRCW